MNEICWADVDLFGKQERINGNVIKGLAHDLILGEPWMRFSNVLYRVRECTLFMEKYQHFVRTCETQ